VEIKLLLKGLIAGAVMQYTSTALAMPFEVGKLLLQVQWVPRDLSLLEGPTIKEEEYEEEAEVINSSRFRNRVWLKKKNYRLPVAQ
jgi:fusion and transport protein UGO1